MGGGRSTRDVGPRTESRAGHREFRWEGFRQTDDLVRHLLGAVLMGVGGVTALGCTFGQGISGIATLSLGSFIAVAGLIAGAWLTLRWELRHV